MQQSTRLANILLSFKKIIKGREASSFPNELQNFKDGSKISVTRKVTDEDVMTFAELTKDFNPIHVNSKKKLVHGALLNGFLSGVLGTKLPGPGTVVIHQDLNYPKPCYAGDSIEITVEVLSARKIVKCGYKIVANSERIVLEGEGKFFMSRNEVAREIKDVNR